MEGTSVCVSPLRPPVHTAVVSSGRGGRVWLGGVMSCDFTPGPL